ncbi:MAG: hypothetical protein PHI06_03070 [Desulfobulbaceae bacterium]|nr:hypothetical protein [Desulfobulbaceae bacterium]
MKKMISITVVALLIGAGGAWAETVPGNAASVDGSAIQAASATPEKGDMGMMGMGQAMMPNMINMMFDSPRTGGMTGGKMMNMPMMGASMMPMGMGGMGMMPLMMNASSEETAASLEKFRAFLKETKDKRKELHDLSFAYFESRWTPETTVQQLQDISLKMRKLRDEIMAKMPK